jgi:hypothetical protein
LKIASYFFFTFSGEKLSVVQYEFRRGGLSMTQRMSRAPGVHPEHSVAVKRSMRTAWRKINADIWNF